MDKRLEFDLRETSTGDLDVLRLLDTELDLIIRCLEACGDQDTFGLASRLKGWLG